MFVVGQLSAKVQPKYLIVVGAVIIAVSMYDMTNVYGDLGFWSWRGRGCCLASDCR
jgi:DHA2 family multidrug resistance protein